MNLIYPVIDRLPHVLNQMKQRRSEGWMFGERYIFGHKESHEGLDLAIPVGEPIYAILDGQIEWMWTDSINGNAIRVSHVGHPEIVRTSFAHLSGYPQGQRPGMDVRKGDIIAYSGGEKGKPGSGISTGPHVHICFWKKVLGENNLYRYTRIDPLPYLERSSNNA